MPELLLGTDLLSGTNWMDANESMETAPWIDSNDVEINPGPYTRGLREMNKILMLKPSEQKSAQDHVIHVINKMNANLVKNEIPLHLLTETNLITIQNMFKLVIKQNYEEETINEVENLMNFYYDKVTEQEKRNNKRRLTQDCNNFGTYNIAHQDDIPSEKENTKPTSRNIKQ